jgi:putative ABC transport system ATP-binding protein
MMEDHGEKSSPANQPILELCNAAFAYPGGRSVFQSATFTLSRGSLTLLKGPSGAGKSTLLRLLNRLEEPTRGAVLYRGRPLSEYPPPVLRREISYLQQTPVLLDSSVRDNLLLPFSFQANQGKTRPNDSTLRDQMVKLLLESVSLEDNATTLSVGQKQRLCLIRTLLLSPSVLLLDEPTAALDQESRAIVENAAETLCLDGVTVLMAGHQEYVPRHVTPALLEVRDGAITFTPNNRSGGAA